MNVEADRYDGHTEEEGGYFQSSGVVYSFSEGKREYKFNVEDSMAEYASSLPSTVDGRVVTGMVHAPYAESSPAIAIPKECPLFLSALRHLRAAGVTYVSFFNQTSGGFSQFEVEALAGA